MYIIILQYCAKYFTNIKNPVKYLTKLPKAKYNTFRECCEIRNCNCNNGGRAATA